MNDQKVRLTVGDVINLQGIPFQVIKITKHDGFVKANKINAGKKRVLRESVGAEIAFAGARWRIEDATELSITLGPLTHKLTSIEQPMGRGRTAPYLVGIYDVLPPQVF